MFFYDFISLSNRKVLLTKLVIKIESPFVEQGKPSGRN